MLRDALLAASALLALGACSALPTVCTDEGRATLSVRVFDARTGAAAAAGASGTIRDGAYTDSLVATSPSVLFAPNTFERPGTYDVAVEKPGYRAWTADDVKVTADACHVRSRTLDARLDPLP